jgi:hypothetical protein
MKEQKGIVKFDKPEIVNFNTQLKIGNGILATIDIYNELLDISNIRNAVNLAVNARKYLDPYYDPNEIIGLNIESLVYQIYKELSNKTFSNQHLHIMYLPKREGVVRRVKYLDIKSYSIRFLMAIILKKYIAFPKSVFYPHESISTLQQNDQFKEHSVAFFAWQKDLISSKEYPWIVISDFKNYYDSIRPNKLVNKILSIIDNRNSDTFKKLLETYLTEIDIGNWCDYFFQNIYLMDLDKALEKVQWISGRFIDDIRVFCKSEADAALSFQIIKNEISKIDLTINETKQFVITNLEDICQHPESSLFQTTAFKEIIRKTPLQNLIQTTPYINVENITKYEIDTLYQWVASSLDGSWWGPKYDKNFERRLNLSDLIIDKTGYKINGVELNNLLEDIEQNKFNNVGANLKDLNIIINNIYGGYRFYERLIRIYIDQLVKAEKPILEEHLIKLLETFQLKIGRRFHKYHHDYYAYLLLKRIFIDDEESKLFSYFEANCSGFIPGLTELFFSIISYPFRGESYIGTYIVKEGEYNYLRAFTHFLFVTKGDENKLDKYSLRWIKSTDFWITSITKLFARINKEISKETCAGNIISIIAFIEPWIKTSQNIPLLKYEAKANIISKNYDQAFNILALLIEKNIHNNDPSILASTAFTLEKLKKFQDALWMYNEYLKLEESSAGYYNRALIKWGNKDFEIALADIDSAIYLDNGNLSYLKTKLRWLLKLEEYEDATSCLDCIINSISDYSENKEYFHLKYEIYIKTKRFEELENIVNEFLYFIRDYGMTSKYDIEQAKEFLKNESYYGSIEYKSNDNSDTSSNPHYNWFF